MYRKQIGLSVLSAFFLSFMVHAEAIVVAGSYADAHLLYPLLASSQDGQSWKYSIFSASPAVPSDFEHGSLSRANCWGSHCIAVGSYFNENLSSYPLIANSTDGGKNWTYTLDSSKPALPQNFQRGGFVSASCVGVNCTAVGMYQEQNATYPLVAYSKDEGKTWTYSTLKDSGSLPPSETLNSELSDVHCAGLRCVAVGRYNGYAGYPFILRSINGGRTWYYVLDATSGNPPEDFKWGWFRTITCAGRNCIAAGTYGNEQEGSGIGFPAIATSHDGGTNWSYSLTRSEPNIPIEYSTGRFIRSHCSQSNCVAVGYYIDTQSNTQILLANSKDGGTTWSYPQNNKTLILPTDFIKGDFYGVYCHKNRCVASGDYYNGEHYYPLLVQSKDGGVTWTTAIDSTVPKLPADFQDEGKLNSVKCAGLHCVAAGGYASRSMLYPLVASSQDGGASWVYQLDSLKPKLPADYTGGGFSSVSMGSASYLPKSLKWLKKI